MNNYEASRFLITHAPALVSTSAFHCSATPSAVNFLIAGLKSAEWSTQRECLNGLIRLFRLNAEDDIRALPPNPLANAQKRLPDHLIDILGSYGMFRTETFMMSTTTRDFQGALMQVLRDQDLYRFGVTLAELITRTEFSIADGSFAAEDPRTGKVDDNFDTGLPFKTYREALPLCAQILRRKAGSGDIVSDYGREVAKIAQKGSECNPHLVYLQYARSMLADLAVGLRAAKKGLMCKTTWSVLVVSPPLYTLLF
ncbi:hypothetical protein D9757_013385 [Collybiopsis confluens]|uniref:Uncharacterized protein n=1 Tax=Collybiopsis confluens TaxID=2823264 RepID=A0A8H5CP68_9AGAR|nr:hypothetical protein D9757_013385 [Collybiopsis confluens]